MLAQQGVGSLEKLLNGGLIIGYITLLTLALATPIFPKLFNRHDAQTRETLHPGFYIAAAIAVVLFMNGITNIYPLLPMLLLPFMGQGRNRLIGGAIALGVFGLSTWWSNPVTYMAIWQWVLFAVTAIALTIAIKPIDWGSAAREPISQTKLLGITAAATLFAIGLGSLSAPFASNFNALMAWHHWGAYLSPVDLLLAGGVPYRDFPVQYGMGPTLVIAASCGTNCWEGMYYTALIANALYAGIMTSAAVLISTYLPKRFRIIAAAAMLCGTLLWTAFPAHLGSVLATPSVASLRFLPLAALLFYILQMDAYGKTKAYLGHLMWSLNIIWSLETAVFASILWWPWLAYRSLKDDAMGKDTILSFVKYALIGIVAFLCVSVLGIAAFRLTFGALPEISSIFAYIQNPPGRISPNLVGPIWLVIMIGILAIGAIDRSRTAASSILYASLLVMLAAFSYYLSRSHDNNILNLFPFILLVGLAILECQAGKSDPTAEATRGYVIALTIAMIAFVATFNFSGWGTAKQQERLYSMGPSLLLSRISSTESDPDPLLNKDAIRLLQYARNNAAGAPVLLDDRAVMLPSKPGQSWTAMNNPANYSPLPAPMIKKYIRQMAKDTQRSGFLIVNERQYGQWPAYFAPYYNMRMIAQHGDYSMYEMLPKNTANT
jgi:hypothetical protein